MTNIILAIHLAALSAIETGDNDLARGRHGEVSRWQCLPRYYHGKHPMDPGEAAGVVWWVWQQRADKFVSRAHRPPTEHELAYLWHCPSRMSHPTRSDRDYARRFKAVYEDQLEKSRGKH